MKLLCVLFSISSAFFATVLPRREECFHETGKAGDKINIMYEVAEGGFLDIDVKVYNPVNKVMYDQQRETSGKVDYTYLEFDSYHFRSCSHWSKMAKLDVVSVTKFQPSHTKL